MPGRIHILLIHPVGSVWDYLAEAIAAESYLNIAARVFTTEEVDAAVAMQQVDIALVDSQLGDKPHYALAALSRICQICPRVKPIILVDQRDPQQMVEYFRHGARGVFTRAHSDLKLLCKCIGSVHRGQIWASREELGWIVKALQEAEIPSRNFCLMDAQGKALLSKREEGVVRLLAEGYTNREIAKALNLSEHTIKNYLFRIFDKVGVSRRTELILFALNNLSPGFNGKKQVAPTGVSTGNEAAKVSW